MGIRQRIAGRKGLIELLVEFGILGPVTCSAHALAVPLIQGVSLAPGRRRGASSVLPSPGQNPSCAALLSERPCDHETAEREPHGDPEREAQPAARAAVAVSAGGAHRCMLTRRQRLEKARQRPADVSVL